MIAVGLRIMGIIFFHVIAVGFVVIYWFMLWEVCFLFCCSVVWHSRSIVPSPGAVWFCLYKRDDDIYLDSLQIDYKAWWLIHLLCYFLHNTPGLFMYSFVVLQIFWTLISSIFCCVASSSFFISEILGCLSFWTLILGF